MLQMWLWNLFVIDWELVGGPSLQLCHMVVVPAQLCHMFVTPTVFLGVDRAAKTIISIPQGPHNCFRFWIKTIRATAHIFVPAASSLVPLLTMNPIKVVVKRFHVLPATIYRIQNKSSTFKLRDLGSQSAAGRSSYDLILDKEGNAVPLDGDEYNCEWADMMSGRCRNPLSLVSV